MLAYYDLGRIGRMWLNIIIINTQESVIINLLSLLAAKLAASIWSESVKWTL